MKKYIFRQKNREKFMQKFAKSLSEPCSEKKSKVHSNRVGKYREKDIPYSSALREKIELHQGCFPSWKNTQ